MRRAAGPPFAEPAVLRIPSARARTAEAGFEVLAGEPSRRFDVWLARFAATSGAVGLCERLGREPWGRDVSLVALVENLDGMPAPEAMAAGATAMAAGVEAVFPPSVAPASLDGVVAGLLDRQRELAAFAEMKRRRRAAALREPGASLSGEGVAPVHPLRWAMVQFQRGYISRVLEEVEGDAAAARQVLGVSRASFHRLLSMYELAHLVRQPDTVGG